jgi:DNA repair exonuclease SbcCD ATPase subunit
MRPRSTKSWEKKVLRKITLSHFRQHIDREFTFGDGMNAIRGDNEQGKTTIFEAFTYFCFGVGALRESLEDVVTYHHPVSKLRVDCEIEHLGVTYRGYRGKSGAEVSFGNEKVTGQREVTKFFEKLFGTSADMAGKLMFASQKSLAESLKAGPTAAGKMIEDLANFDLIDRVAEAIAARRQTGNTAGVEGRIAALQAQLVETPPEDLAPLRAEVEQAQAAVTGAEQGLAALRTSRAELDVEQARQIEQRKVQLDRLIETATVEIDDIERALAAPAVVGPTERELAAARAAVEEEKLYSRAAVLHAELVCADTSEQWDQNLASLEAEVTKTQGRVEMETQTLNSVTQSMTDLERQHAAAMRDSDVKIAQLEGRLIKESTCALCQKDLADVPEVVRTNSELQAQINAVRAAAVTAAAAVRERHAELERDRLAARESLAEQQQYLKDLQAVIVANAKVEQLYARAADFISVDRSVVPGRWTWTGPAIAGERLDVVGALARLERAARAATADAAMRAEKQAQRERIKVRRDADTLERGSLQLKDALETLDMAQRLGADILSAEQALRLQQATLQRLRADLNTREALAAQAARQLEQTRAQLDAAQAELAAMQRYNLLIKKVRAARPVITNKLWNIVLGGVSKHLSEIRDTPSTITRADGTFKCNGFPVSGLSGSAEDMLGLAMRITLTRTFLPGANMLHLDEPGAACSDARETRMLGLLSKLDFGQIIMISHNPLVDAVADRIITV